MGRGPVTEPLGELGEQQANLLALQKIIDSGVGARSRWALNAAAEAARTEGIAGILVLKIPPKGKDYVDITFTIGQVEVVSRWTG